MWLLSVFAAFHRAVIAVDFDAGMGLVDFYLDDGSWYCMLFSDVDVDDGASRFALDFALLMSFGVRTAPESFQ